MLRGGGCADRQAQRQEVVLRAFACRGPLGHCSGPVRRRRGDGAGTDQNGLLGTTYDDNTRVRRYKCLTLEFAFQNSVRSSMPTWSHRRGDLYGLAVSGEHSAVQDDQDGHFHFGPVNIPASCVVFVSRLSYVCVNRKPVLPGHLLVVPKRSDVPRLADLTAEEVADLFLAVQRAQKVTEVHFSCSASTVSVQDGAAAGRTIEHVHVHVLPRSEGDFANNDDIYEELAKHDKGNDVKWRSQDEMVQEAAAMRQTADKLM